MGMVPFRMLLRTPTPWETNKTRSNKKPTSTLDTARMQIVERGRGRSPPSWENAPSNITHFAKIGEGKSLLSGDNVRALFLPSLYDKQSPALLTQPGLRAIQEVARELVPARPHGLFNDSNVVATVDGDQVRRILEYKHTRLC